METCGVRLPLLAPLTLYAVLMKRRHGRSKVSFCGLITKFACFQAATVIAKTDKIIAFNTQMIQERSPESNRF